MSLKPDYTIKRAADEGRIAAYDFIEARSRYPLALTPMNPYQTASSECFDAWRIAFDETMQRHANTRTL